MPNFEQLYGPALNLELNSSDSNTLFTSTRRQQAINDGMVEFADLTECLVRQSSITVSCNTAEYHLLSSGVLGGSTDYVRLAAQGVEYRVRSSNSVWKVWLTGDDFPQRPVRWRGRNQDGWRTSTSPGTPSGYYLRPDGGNVYLGLDLPPKVGSSEAAEIIVPYVARPAPMTSSGTEPFTVNSTTRTDLRNYHQALPHYAAYRLLPLIGDDAGAQTQLQKFMSYVQRYVSAMRPKGGTYVQLGSRYLRAARLGRRAWGRTGSALIPPSQWS